MGRRSRKNRRRRLKRRSGKVSIPNAMSVTRRVGFRSFATQAWPNTTTAVTTYAIQASNFGDRLTGMSDQFALWRLTKFGIRVYQNSKNTSTSSIVASWGVSVLPGLLTTTAPTALEDLVDHAAFMSGSYAELEIKSQSLTVPKASLQQSIFGSSWRSTRDIGDDLFYILGRVYVIMSAASDLSGTTMYVVFEGEADFKGSIDPDMNPLPRNGNKTLSEQALSELKVPVSEISPSRSLALQSHFGYISHLNKVTRSGPPVVIGNDDLPVLAVDCDSSHSGVLSRCPTCLHEDHYAPAIPGMVNKNQPIRPPGH